MFWLGIRAIIFIIMFQWQNNNKNVKYKNILCVFFLGIRKFVTEKYKFQNNKIIINHCRI